MKEVERFHDFGKAAFGYLELELAGDTGESVQWTVGEVLDPAGRIDRNPPGSCVCRSGSVTLEEGRTHYDILFPAHTTPWEVPHKIHSPADREIAPFRYVEVSGKCLVLEIRRHELYPREFCDSDSSFESSDADLNRVWDFCKYSIKATAAFGIFIDGDRERLPYEADAYVNQLGWFVHCADPAIARRTIDFFECHPTWPTEWRLITPILARDYWLYTGDRPSVDRWLAWLPDRLLGPLRNASSPLVTPDGKIRDIVDWPPEERADYEFGTVNFVPNAFLYSALLAMYELTHCEDYLNQARQVRSALYAQMFRNGLFVDNPASGHTSFHTAMFALWNNLASDPEPLKKIIQSHRMACSVYGAQFLLDACFRYGMADHAFSLLRASGDRSWLDMLAHGSTITMEAWNHTVKPNQDWTHAWGSAPANLIARFIGGIRPSAPGFREFIFDPAPCALEWFKLRHPVPSGAIEVEYVRNEGYALRVPSGCVGTGFSARFAPGNQYRIPSVREAAV